MLWSWGLGVGASFKEWRVSGCSSRGTMSASSSPGPGSSIKEEVPRCGEGRRKPLQAARKAAGDEDWLAKKGKVDSIGGAGGVDEKSQCFPFSLQPLPHRPFHRLQGRA